MTPPAVARIVVVPAATPVTRPLAETVATAVFVDDQLKPVTDFGGEAVAVSCTVPFTAMLAPSVMSCIAPLACTIFPACCCRSTGISAAH